MQQRSGSLLLTAAGALALLAACQSAPLHQPHDRATPQTAAPAPPSTAAERRLAEAKPLLMSADYRADLADLARLREQVAPLADDPAVGYLAHYWAGFASWRLAINGANHGMSVGDIKAHLESAAADFEACIRLRDDFADGYAAAASVNGWLTGITRDDTAVMREHLALATSRLARAKDLLRSRLTRRGLGLAVTGVDVGHGEQHHFGTKRVEDGDRRLQVGGEVPVPGRLADVHPLPVEQVVGHLPAAQAQRNDLRMPLRGEEGPEAAPEPAPLRGRTRRARGQHLELGIEVAAQGGVVGDGDAVRGGRSDREPLAQGHGDGVADDQQPHGVASVGSRALQRGVLGARETGREREGQPARCGRVGARDRRCTRGGDGGQREFFMEVFSPRYSHLYAAVQNRPSLLVESHSLKAAKTRAWAHYDIMRHSIETILLDPDGLRRAVREADRDISARAGNRQPADRPRGHAHAAGSPALRAACRR